MEIVEQMLTGQIEMSEFIDRLKTNKDLQNIISNLIPQEAVGNPDHVIWQKISYNAFKRENFDLLTSLRNRCKMDGSIGDNLNIFSIIYGVYRYEHPELNETTKYRDASALYLDVTRDCFEGPEVRQEVEAIVIDALAMESKSKRKKEAINRVNALFHVTGRKRPRWIQGAEWPMGKNSPMEYLSQKEVGDVVQYTFRDVDTGDVRIVEQDY